MRFPAWPGRSARARSESERPPWASRQNGHATGAKVPDVETPPTPADWEWLMSQPERTERSEPELTPLARWLDVQAAAYAQIGGAFAGFLAGQLRDMVKMCGYLDARTPEDYVGRLEWLRAEYYDRQGRSR